MQLRRRFLAGREAATTATDTAGSLAAQWANPDAILRGRAGDIVALLEWTSSWCVTKPSWRSNPRLQSMSELVGKGHHKIGELDGQ
jgi:hypothetical protein